MSEGEHPILPFVRDVELGSCLKVDVNQFLLLEAPLNKRKSVPDSAIFCCAYGKSVVYFGRNSGRIANGQSIDPILSDDRCDVLR